jgi:hypothetical protein
MNPIPDLLAMNGVVLWRVHSDANTIALHVNDGDVYQPVRINSGSLGVDHNALRLASR